MLIVVAIIGILAAILIPNAITAIQKARQKTTMKDMIIIATACADYVTDNGKAPDAGNQDGALAAGNNFIQAVSPFYVKACPVNDQWGNAFAVHSGTAAATISGIDATIVGDDDFVIVSYGRKGVNENFTFNPSDPLSGLFTVSGMPDFEKDLINWNGAWIRAPRVSNL